MPLAAPVFAANLIELRRAQRIEKPGSGIMNKSMKFALGLLALILAVSAITDSADARGRRHSHRVGGYNSHGKGSHYVGGY